MKKFIPMETGYSDSTSPISEAPDITNWFSSYVYESFPLSSSVKENESELKNGISFGEAKENIGVAVSQDNSQDHTTPRYKRIKQISDRNLCESLPSEPPDIGNWFSSYVYESPMLDTSDALELPGESECVKETQTEEDTTYTYTNHVCPRLFEQQLVSSAKVTDFSQSLSLLSEPPHVRNWFSSYEYQSSQLSDIHELGFFSSSQKDQLIIDESDTEEENTCRIFRRNKSKQETIALTSNDSKGNTAADTAKEVSSDNAFSDQEMEKTSSIGLFKKIVKQESSLEQEQLFCESRKEERFSPRVSRYNQKPESLSKQEASLQESNSVRPPRNLEENQKTDDKENVSTETGFVTMKKATRDQCSKKKPNREVLVECIRSRELKKIDREEGGEEEEERKKKRRVLGEMSNIQFSGAEEIAGKWRCPQKNKGKSGPPLKQLRLDAWMHKV